MRIGVGTLGEPEPSKGFGAIGTPTWSGEIQATDLAFEYPNRLVWHDLTFSFDAGSCVALVGQSGSGKTTLLQCLGSLAKPSSGSLDVFGVRPATLTGSSLRRFRRESVGFAFQNAGVVASWSVKKNLEVGGFRLTSNQDRVKEVFDRFALDLSLLDSPVYRLSGGEQQRVGIIRLALRRPQLLLMDEPTSALDDVNTDRVIDFLSEHCAGGGIAVVATHDPRLIDRSNATMRLAREA